MDLKQSMKSIMLCLNGNLVATASESYTILYYDNGKVHISAHSISKNTAAGYGSSDFIIVTYTYNQCY